MQPATSKLCTTHTTPAARDSAEMSGGALESAAPADASLALLLSRPHGERRATVPGTVVDLTTGSVAVHGRSTARLSQREKSLFFMQAFALAPSLISFLLVGNRFAQQLFAAVFRRRPA